MKMALLDNVLKRDNNVIKKIAEQHGEDILLDRQKLSGFIADYIPGDEKTKNLLADAIKENIPKKLYDMKPMSERERERRIKLVCKQFIDNHSLLEDEAYRAVNYFASAFGLEEIEPQKNLPASKPAPAQPKPAKPRKKFKESFLYKILLKLREKILAGIHAVWKRRKKISDIENFGYKCFFWVITSVLAVGICYAVFVNLTPHAIEFMKSVNFADYIDNFENGDILENTIYYLALTVPYLLLAAGIGNTIIYNKKAIKFYDISAKHCIVSGFRCVLGHLVMASLIAAAFLLINIVIILFVAPDISPPAEILINLMMPGILMIGASYWGLRIFANKKITGFVTLSLLIIFGFGIYNGWLSGFIDALPVPA